MESKNDELNFLDMKLSDAYLEHHGVKGMKWGVWNAATRAKYLGGKIASVGAKSASVLGSAVGAVGRKAGNSASALGERIKARIGSAKAKSAQKKEEKKQAKIEAKEFKRQQKEELELHRKEIGMSKSAYNKLREQTLKSHDPEVVAKGMHTLTDAELETKLSRLDKESKINKWAYAEAEQREKVIQAKFKTITDSPVYKLTSDAVSKSAGILLTDTIVKNGLQPVLDQRVTYAANKSQNKFFDKHTGATRSESAETSAKAVTDKAIKSFKADYETKMERQNKASEASAESLANKYIKELKENRRDSSGRINSPNQSYYDDLKANRRDSSGRINTGNPQDDVYIDALRLTRRKPSGSLRL